MVKKYIGVHKGKEDDNYIGSGTYFLNAVKKYGIENFERKILYREYENLENLYMKEIDIINELNAVFSSDYYNQTNFDPKYCQYYVGKKKQRRVSSETRAKLSFLAKNRTTEHKRKISKSKLGDKNPFCRDDVKEKIKETKNKNGSYGKGGNKGMKWYNNGSISKMYFPENVPEGWVKGCLNKKVGFLSGELNVAKRPEVRKKISESLKNSEKWKAYQLRKKQQRETNENTF